MYKHILIPTDGSELSRKAVEAGIDYARETGARVTLFTAVPEYHAPSEAEIMSHRAQSLEAFERESAAKAQSILAGAAEPAGTRASRRGFRDAACCHSGNFSSSRRVWKRLTVVSASWN